jgi:hypothetical protein
MAAGENQTEAIVVNLLILDLFVSARNVVEARFHMCNKIPLRLHRSARAGA